MASGDGSQSGQLPAHPRMRPLRDGRVTPRMGEDDHVRVDPIGAAIEVTADESTVVMEGPISASDSMLRRLVLDRSLLALD